MWLLGILCMLSVLVADYGGGYAGSTFRYGSNAREFALAGALVADKTPGFYVFSNPALLQYARTSQLGLSYQSMSLDRSIQSMCFVKNLPPSAGLGIAIIRAATGNIEGKDLMNENTKTFTSQEILGIISFGVSIDHRLALGLNIKTFFSNIAPEIIEIQSSNGIGFDLGLLYKFHRYFIIGGVIENVRSIYNWKITKNSDQDSYEEILPQTIKLGITYKGIKGTTIYFQEDMMKIPGKENVNYRSRLGIEYRLLMDIKIRGGLKQIKGSFTHEENNKVNLKPSFGIGVPLKLWNEKLVRMDYALDPGSVEEGLSHLFSFSLKL